jgi:hypothetical protein
MRAIAAVFLLALVLLSGCQKDASEASVIGAAETKPLPPEPPADPPPLNDAIDEEEEGAGGAFIVGAANGTLPPSLPIK